MSIKTQKNLQIVGKIRKNLSSKEDDNNLKIVIDNIIEYFNGKYGYKLPENWQLVYDENISSELLNIIMINNNVPYDERKWILSCKTDKMNVCSIKTDGGFLYLKKIDNYGNIIELHPVLCSEMKKQGTIRGQAKGNAIERIFKNYNFFVDGICKYEDLTPFVAFCHGIDFTDEFILSKLRMGSINEVNKIQCIKTIYKKNNRYYEFPKTSLMCKENDWTISEMFEICKTIVDIVMDYYDKTIFKKEKKCLIPLKKLFNN